MFESPVKQKPKFAHPSNDVSFTVTVSGGTLTPIHSLTLLQSPEGVRRLAANYL